MKRTIIYLVIFALILLAPVDRLDVAKLRPVEVIYIYKEEDRVILQTDTGDMGYGPDAIQALADMRSKSPAVIYLDTAEFLLIGEGTSGAVETLRDQLKENVKVCGAKGHLDLSLIGEYLAVHGEFPALKTWNADTRLPLVYKEKEMLKMLKNIEKSA